MNPPEPALNSDFCRQRQQRFSRVLQRNGIDQALLIRPEHVQYFTGFRPPAVLQAAVLLKPDGRTLLCVPNEAPQSYACDDVVTYEAQWRCTLRQDQLSATLAAISSIIGKERRRLRIGIEGSVNPAAFMPWQPGDHEDFIDIEPDLWKLRRRKDPDELALIQQAIECTEAMYSRAKEILAPGISEIEVYNQLHARGVEVTGEPLLAFGNDFQCNSPGGPPRHRPAEQGELFILDLGVNSRGYYSDNCRTFCVGDQATDDQMQAWQTIVNVLDFVERTVKPGASARQFYMDAVAMLNAIIHDGCFHHLGHGIGLSPHEAPHLNDFWDDVFVEGEVFTAEPALYAPRLRAGIRLEDDFLVTAAGTRRLTSFSRTL